MANGDQRKKRRTKKKTSVRRPGVRTAPVRSAGGAQRDRLTQLERGADRFIEQNRPPTTGETAQGVGLSFLQGTQDLVSFIPAAIEGVAPNPLTRGFLDRTSRTSDFLQEQKPEAFERAESQEIMDRDEEGNPIYSTIRAPNLPQTAGVISRTIPLMAGNIKAFQAAKGLASGIGRSFTGGQALSKKADTIADLTAGGISNAAIVAPLHYEEVRGQALEEGFTEEEAQSRARRSAGRMIGVSGVTGAAGLGIGARLARGAQGRISGGARGALAEVPSEAVEEAAESISEDVALGHEIDKVKALTGAALGAIAGGVVGGGLGAVEAGGAAEARRRGGRLGEALREADRQQGELEVPEPTGTLGRALAEAPEAAAQQAEAQAEEERLALPSPPEEVQALEDTIFPTSISARARLRELGEQDNFEIRPLGDQYIIRRPGDDLDETASAAVRALEEQGVEVTSTDIQEAFGFRQGRSEALLESIRPTRRFPTRIAANAQRRPGETVVQEEDGSFRLLKPEQATRAEFEADRQRTGTQRQTRIEQLRRRTSPERSSISTRAEEGAETEEETTTSEEQLEETEGDPRGALPDPDEATQRAAEAVQQMQEATGSPPAAVLQELSRRVDEVAQVTPRGDERRVALEGQLTELRERVPEAREDIDAALQTLRETEGRETPSEPQPAPQRDLVVQDVPFESPPEGVNLSLAPDLLDDAAQNVVAEDADGNVLGVLNVRQVGDEVEAAEIAVTPRSDRDQIASSMIDAAEQQFPGATQAVTRNASPELAGTIHRKAVENALRQDRAVNARALEDYPDLVPFAERTRRRTVEALNPELGREIEQEEEAEPVETGGAFELETTNDPASRDPESLELGEQTLQRVDPPNIRDELARQSEALPVIPRLESSQAGAIRGMLDLMTTFQGQKTQLARNTTGHIKKFFGDSLSKIKTINDYFGGSGGWGAYLSNLTPHVETINIYEYSPERLSKIKAYHEHGDRFPEFAERFGPALERMAEMMDIDKGVESFSGSAIGRRAKQLVEQYKDDPNKPEEFDWFMQAVIDQANSYGSQGTSALEAVKTHVRRAMQQAPKVKARIDELKDRGITINYNVADSFELTPQEGEEVLSVVDPPYYGTKAYDKSGKVKADTYAQVKDMLERLQQANNRIVYTDEAWWLKNEQPADPDTEIDGMNARHMTRSIANGFHSIGLTPVETRTEILGLYDPAKQRSARTTAPSAREGRGEGGFELERPGVGRSGTQGPGGVEREPSLSRPEISSQTGRTGSPVFSDLLNTLRYPAVDGSEVEVAGVPPDQLANEQVVSDAQREWVQNGTNSRYFQEWFGNSRLTQNGAPALLYHGANPIFSGFENAQTNTGTPGGGLGIWLTMDQNRAANHGDQVVAAYGKLENPYMMSQEELNSLASPAEASARADELQERGHDGVFVRETRTAIIFDPDNIRALNQPGTYEEVHSEVKFSDPGFYSRASRVVQNTQMGAPKKADAKTWKRWLDGMAKKGAIKKAELDWIGIYQWLEDVDIVRGAGAISRAEVAEYIEMNQPDLSVRTLTGREAEYYQSNIPGGENYREVVININNPPSDFSVGHFIETGYNKNLVVHGRADDRTHPRHGRIYSILEVQSDVAQNFQEEGDTQGDIEELFHSVDERTFYEVDGAGLYTERERARDIARQRGMNERAITEVRGIAEVDAGGFLQTVLVPPPEEFDALLQERRDEVDARNERIRRERGPIRTPFSRTEDWAMLQIRTMTQQAIREGYDSVMFPTPKTGNAIEGFAVDDTRLEEYLGRILPKAVRKWVKKYNSSLERVSVGQGEGFSEIMMWSGVHGELIQVPTEQEARRLMENGTAAPYRLAAESMNGIEVYETSSFESSMELWQGGDEAVLEVVPEHEFWLFKITPEMKEARIDQRLPRWSTAEGVAGMNGEAVNEAIDQVKKKWKNAPDIRVVQSTTDLPFAAPPTAAGAYFNGEIYLIGDNLQSPQHAQFVALHETMGHFGLLGTLGNGLKPAMMRIARENPTISNAARIWLENRQQAENRRARAEGREPVQLPEDTALAVEEVLADIAGTGHITDMTGWERFVLAIRNALRRMGFDMRMSDTEVIALLADSRRYVLGEVQTPIRNSMEPRFARVELREAADMFSEQAWEDAREITSGLSRSTIVELDVDDFLMMAARLPQPDEIKLGNIQDRLEDGIKMNSLPQLWFNNNGDGTAKVDGHEGRHRALTLKQAGIRRMPVILHSGEAGDGSAIRWVHQKDPKHPNYIRTWPKKLLSERGPNIQIDFPVPRDDNTTVNTPEDNAKFHRAWHGSPYDYDKVTLAKVGTGEGGEAFGWGFNAAGDRGVGTFYRDLYSPKEYRFTVDGQIFEVGDVNRHWQDFDPQEYAVYLLGVKGPRQSRTELMRLTQEHNQSQWVKEFKKHFKQLQGRVGVREESFGKLYEVELLADEEEYLDLDLPIAEQPSFVRDTIMGDEIFQRMAGGDAEALAVQAEGISGRDFYEAVANEFVDEGSRNYELASKYLLEKGILGSQYLDQKSRQLDLEALRADGNRYMDPRKPLVDQPVVLESLMKSRVVRDFFIEQQPDAATTEEAVERSSQMTGEDFMAAFEDYVSGDPDLQPTAVRRHLVSHGVVGLMVGRNPVPFDERGHHNYVIFDDRLVDIKAKFSNVPNSQQIPLSAALLSNPANARDAAGKLEAGIKRLPTWQTLKDFVTNRRRGSLNFLTRQQMVKLGRDYFGTRGDALLDNFEDAARRMDADANKKNNESYETMRKWMKWTHAWGRGAKEKHRQAAALADLMHDATVAGIDADPEVQQEIRPDEQQALNQLQSRFRKLPKELQELYRDVRKKYEDQRSDLLKALTDRIEQANMAENKRRAMVTELTRQFAEAQRKGVYFPLARFGDHWVWANVPTAEGNGIYEMHDTVQGQREAIQRLAEEYNLNPKDTSQINSGKKVRGLANIMGLTDQFMGDVAKVVGETVPDAETQGALMDNLYQLYLRHLPEMSVKKHFIHRTNTPGYSKDALRAFADHMSHSARQTAKIRHGWRLQDVLNQLNRELANADDPNGAADVLEGLTKSFQWMMNPQVNSWATRMTSWGFAWYLGLTPAAAIVNMSQLPLVTLPELGSKYGFAKASGALSKAFKDYAKTAPHMIRGESERAGKTLKASKAAREKIEKEFGGGLGQMLRELEEDGTIDRTQSMSLIGMSEETGEASVQGERVMRNMAVLFHGAEVANREVTAIATYRLARQGGKGVKPMNHADALRAARDAILDTHFDYTSANRAAFMRGNVARVIFLFKQYAQNMTWYIGRNFYLSFKGDDIKALRKKKKEQGLSAKEQEQLDQLSSDLSLARRKLGGVMGMASVFSGVMGLPFVQTMMWILNAVANIDDDEPVDFELEFRNFLADSFGSTLGTTIARGPVNQITGANFADRVEIGQLFFRTPDRELEMQGLVNHYLEEFLGPVVGMGLDGARGIDMVTKGQWQRGMELLTPKLIRDSSRAIRYSQEGARTLRGDPILEDVSAYQSWLQALGFTPAELTEIYSQRAGLKRLEQRILNRRSNLLSAYWLAQRNDDRDWLEKVKGEIKSYNHHNPEFPITGSTISRSMKARGRLADQQIDGAIFTKSIRDLIEQKRYLDQ